MNDKFVFTSSVVDLAEEQDYLILKNRICYFSSPNLNNVQLEYNDDTEACCQTMVDTPLVARYVKRDGKDDLGGHEVRVVNNEYEFMTQAVGVNKEIEIVEEEVELVNGTRAKLPCLYCTEKLWTRFKNVTAAVKRLYDAGELHTSWELKSDDYSFKNGVKYINNFTFIGNCILGSNSYPAYGKMAQITDISETSNEYEYLAAESLLGEALALDLESASASNINQLDDTNRKEGPSMDVNENTVVDTSEEEVVEETVEINEVEDTATTEANKENNDGVAEVSEGDPVEESTTEDAEAEEAENENSSMKTDSDIRQMLEEAVARETIDDEFWYGVSMVFPEEHIVLCHSWRMPALSFLKFNYEINGEDVSLSGRENIELVVSPLNINSEIESKNNTLAEANSRIEELSRCKEELDKIKAEQASAERAEAVNKLRDYVVKSGRFTDEEIASEEVQKAINELNEAWIKAEIADRLVASMAGDKEKAVETSEVKTEDNTVSILLSESSGKNAATPDDVMNKFFNRD